MSRATTEHELFVRIRETLETYGWIRGRLGGCDTGFCLLGAAYHVMGGDLSLDGKPLGGDTCTCASCVLGRHVGEYTQRRFSTPTSFNDNSTKDEVMGFLDKMIGDNQ